MATGRHIVDDQRESGSYVILRKLCDVLRKLFLAVGEVFFNTAGTVRAAKFLAYRIILKVELFFIDVIFHALTAGERLRAITFPPAEQMGYAEGIEGTILEEFFLNVGNTIDMLIDTALDLGILGSVKQILYRTGILHILKTAKYTFCEKPPLSPRSVLRLYNSRPKRSESDSAVGDSPYFTPEAASLLISDPVVPKTDTSCCTCAEKPPESSEDFIKKLECDQHDQFPPGSCDQIFKEFESVEEMTEIDVTPVSLLGEHPYKQCPPKGDQSSFSPKGNSKKPSPKQTSIPASVVDPSTMSPSRRAERMVMIQEEEISPVHDLFNKTSFQNSVTNCEQPVAMLSQVPILEEESFF